MSGTLFFQKLIDQRVIIVFFNGMYNNGCIKYLPTFQLLKKKKKHVTILTKLIFL